ncbi:UDP-N-acetylmuramoyl-tripeptide--D-alanyl-D-alanine ligase [Vreelandella venusta]|uniref:Glutamate ligase n=1 Tax=Vreelandella venusta TaxID=44935 RepID=A0ABX2BFV0_9GAMM|nr:UDP-N-acetylmuramoyl-tripeptide--D-alanyl-D-alanine ligase [Halomonas venusta]AZM97160.1 glutamate ligase [Halomonas venusta]NPT32842.1 glutamate ligase [Halomonas venusta]
MRQQSTVKKPTSARSAQPKAKPPQVRSFINEHPAKKLSELIVQAKAPLEAELSKAHLPVSKPLTLFLSFTDGLQRATVVQFSGKHLAEVWKKLADWQQRKFKESPKVRWLRIDWVTETRAMPWADCLKEIHSVKRNYFRYGVSLDTNFRYAFLEQELNANAMLYLGGNQPRAALNKKNFLIYGVKRYGKHFSLPAHQDQALLFTTQAILVQPDQPHKLLHGYSGGQEGRNTGRRIIEKLDPVQVTSLIQQSSQFLAEQVDATGRFIYGIHPCFDRDINAYNTLRHTSTTYSMLEAWEVTQSSELKSAIDRSIEHLTSQLIRQYSLPSGETLAYLQDSNNEIKLGGNAVCLLALVKYTELTNDQQYLPLMEQLALGIQHMQHQATGQFNHVLNADDLSIKEEFRIIYYDGEAAFGLMRLYGLTKDERWLNTVEKAFEYFIEKEHWKIHDHWLSYCVNELTLYRPEERYYQFGIKNVAGYLGFVIGRITTFPTLLELMMAAHKMITRLKASDQHRHLLEQIDLKMFYRALETRAHYLLNGFFWPEFAIYFQNPQRIMGSFFIRHHSFRVRIDDVEHYLSGYVAFLNHYLKAPLAPSPVINDRVWNAHHIETATGGRWLRRPTHEWFAKGVKYFAPSVCGGDLVVVRGEGEKVGVLPSRVSTLPTPAGIMVSSSSSSTTALESTELPILEVDNSGEAILALGRYARNQLSGVVVGVTGSSGKTTAVAMLSHVLATQGDVYASAHNANLPHGIAWNLASAGWDLPHLVLEMAVGRMPTSSRMARPHVAVFLNVHPAHIGSSHTVTDIARVKSAIFEGMSPGGVAVINRDMLEFEMVYSAAIKNKQRVILFGEHEQSDIRLISYDNATQVATLSRYGGPQENMKIGAAGHHMALNSLAVIAVTTALDYPLAPILERLKTFRPLPGRGEEKLIRFKGRQFTLINDAYNANPGSMVAALDRLGHLTVEGQRIAILGQMEDLGPSAEHYHTALLEAVERAKIDALYVVGPHYRTFWERLPTAQQGAYVVSIEALKTVLADTFNNGDGVLVKGSNSTGMYKIVAWLESEQD